MTGPMTAAATAYVVTDPGVPVFGSKGASLHVRAVLRELVRRGHEVHLVCARTGGEPPTDPDDPLARVTVHPLPAVRGDDRAVRERSAQASDAAVGSVLDALHDAHGLRLVYERYSLWGRTATAWSQRHDVPHVLEVNAPLVEEQARHRGLVDRAGAEAVAREAVAAAGTVVCVTDDVRDWARTLTDHPERVHTVANGVDTHAIRPARHAPRPAASERFTVGFVGTLKPWHGVEVLLEAVALLVRRDPTWRLLLVGAGPEQERLEDQARALGVADHVELTGAVPSSEVPALLHRMDLATAPYPPLEECYFSPLKVYEYLAAGLPVVASRVGVLPTLLDGGPAGTLGALVTPGAATELADALDALREDLPRRTRLRRDTRAAATEHDWSHVVTRILALVEEVPARVPV
jgi:glycosyltransferase involved in cell wall biosynthesis